MGFEIWEQYRNEFPVTQNLVYLNHAAVSPLCRRAADAMRSLATDAEQWGSFHYPQWMACYDGLRAAAAKMINAAPGEIAIVKNTSEGIATIALGLDWRPGDKIVAFHGEFPANQYPWQKLASRGVTIEWLPPDAPLDQIDAAATGARLLAISYVQFLSGYRADLAALGEICHRRQVFFFVDAIQGLGAYPLDVRAMRIHALAADGTVLRDVAVFRHAYTLIGLGWLYAPTRWPVLGPLADGLYRLWAAGRLRLTRRPSLDQLCAERAGRCRI